MRTITSELGTVLWQRLLAKRFIGAPTTVQICRLIIQMLYTRIMPSDNVPFCAQACDYQIKGEQNRYNVLREQWPRWNDNKQRGWCCSDGNLTIRNYFIRHLRLNVLACIIYIFHWYPTMDSCMERKNCNLVCRKQRYSMECVWGLSNECKCHRILLHCHQLTQSSKTIDCTAGIELITCMI